MDRRTASIASMCIGCAVALSIATPVLCLTTPNPEPSLLAFGIITAALNAGFGVFLILIDRR